MQKMIYKIPFKIKRKSIEISFALFSDAGAINVALNKLASYCNTETLLNKLVDGIKTLTNFERHTETCPLLSFVKVKLGGNYIVHYVVVFEGEGENNAFLT